MRRTIVVALMLGWLAPAQAGSHSCDVPAYLTHGDATLPLVKKAAQEARRLDVLVVGTGSSSLSGPQGSQASYPARLEIALKQRLPGVDVAVRTDIKTRRTAGDMATLLPNLLLDSKPLLVVWQTGTVDAMRALDPDEFRSKLDKGVAAVHSAGADVVLMNMQYSPRTESMIAVGPYVDTMRLVSQQNGVPLFDRLAVMKHWSETGAFDLTGPNTGHMAEKVHDCLARLLAELIVDSAHFEQNNAKENR